MHKSRWTPIFALVALMAGCGGGGSSDDAPPTASSPEGTVSKAPVYDVSAALLALFNAQFSEGKATAKIDGLIFDLKVTPSGGGPPLPPLEGSTIPAVTYWTSSLSLQLTANGYWDSHGIGYRYERSPLQIVGAVMSTPQMTAVFADASQSPPTIPSAALIGESQEMVRGARYELDYSAGYDKPAKKVPLPGLLARGWRLDPDTGDAAFLCLTVEVDEGRGKAVDDYCYSIRPDGRPTGRFRATITDTDTGQRHEFEQSSSIKAS